MAKLSFPIEFERWLGMFSSIEIETALVRDVSFRSCSQRWSRMFPFEVDVSVGLGCFLSKLARDLDLSYRSTGIYQ